MILDSAVGEVNNISSAIVAKNVYHLDECNKKNKLINRKFVPMGKIDANTGKSANRNLIEVTSFSESLLQQLEIPYFVWSSATKLVWYDVVKIYLRDIDDFFKNMPSTQQISKFNFTINTNLSDNSSWTETLGRGDYVDSAKSNPNLDASVATVGTLASVAEAQKQIQSQGIFYFKPTKVVANNGNSTCCPFLLGDAGLSRHNMLDTAMCLLPTDTNTEFPTVKISSKIGWPSKTQTYLMIPQVKWSPEVLPSVISNEPYQFYCRSATIDNNTFINLVPGTSGIKRPLNNQWSRVRNIYLVPFITNAGFGVSPNITTVLPYESPISSVPVTNSFVYLSRIQLYMGGKPLLPSENNVTNIDYYDNQLYRVMNPNGNNGLGKQSGMISKFDFRGAYHYYQFDMSQYCSDDVADATPKSFEIGFDIASLPCVAVNVVVIVEYEKNYKINRFTSEIVM